MLIPWERVAAVACEADPANWDADPAPDGLALIVQPIDCWGRPIAAHGFLHVELVARVRRNFAAAPHGRGAVSETLGRWTKQLATALPTPHGYLVKLPIPAGTLSPDRLASPGRLHVRLVVPGQGVFEASCGAVELLP